MSASGPQLSVALPPELVDALAERVAERIGESHAATSEPWVDVDRAAAHLSCKRQRIYDLVSKGDLPHRRDGRRLLFRCSDLDRWLAPGS